MKKSARSNWQMLLAVVEFLEREATEMSNVDRIPALMETLKNNRLRIQELDAQRKKDITLITLKKNDKLNHLNDETIKLCGALNSFAHNEGMKQLKEQMKVSKSHLNRGSGTDNLSRCISYFSVAEEYATALAPYGWDEERITAHRALLEEVSLLITAPRQAQTNRSKIIKETYGLIDECMSLLKNQLDPLVAQLEQQFPLVVGEYTALRKSINYGVRYMNDPVPASPEDNAPDPPSDFPSNDTTPFDEEDDSTFN